MFSVGDVKITTGHLTATGIAGIVIGIIVFVITSYIAYRKRKEIAESARRISGYVRRASERIRGSFGGGEAEPEQPAEPMNEVHRDML